MWRRLGLFGVAILLCQPLAAQDAGQLAAKKSGAEFYDLQVRPILEAHCYACHAGLDGKAVKSSFNLSTREGLLKGGENGLAISLDKPDESALVRAINYQQLEMPPKGKLPQAQIEVLTKWVALGAPWSENAAPGRKTISPPVDERAKNFWSFRPVQRPAIPEVKNAVW